ncbi:hypothetical protein AB0395_07940 [Streptosporangium sp. NPDC051023]|uniref:hypothetical protein n=1 Tax=Streptosporangium sp. NPDC051023 TaxID=3155410 RepID=UPI00344B4BA1
MMKGTVRARHHIHWLALIVTMAAVLVGIQAGTVNASTVTAKTPATVYPVRLWMDKSSYYVGEYPYYSVTGPPYTPIYWSSTQNGPSTGEVDTFYGHYTDAYGNWTGYGGPWLYSHIGSWSKTVKLNGVTATAYFSVS